MAVAVDSIHFSKDRRIFDPDVPGENFEGAVLVIANFLHAFLIGAQNAQDIISIVFDKRSARAER